MKRIVIVGSSLAAVRAAETLRQIGHTGAITLIGVEPGMPYDRPPLSKKYLAGEVDAERIALRKPEMIDTLDITWRLGSAAVALDTGARAVTLADGSTVPYDGLIIATGGDARTLPNMSMEIGRASCRERV